MRALILRNTGKHTFHISPVYGPADRQMFLFCSFFFQTNITNPTSLLFDNIIIKKSKKK